ncbi:TRAP transporter 4TM/12TM fusion protein [Malaciobacter marinus]|jgi:TRAP transporter 4TM/12TM fusion protein|uniref:TRAP transporter 4TM/12TM fusion protein n=1 Tax=Malaciobacter marinus TaxID=505249 RepID=A0AB36ZXT8_9BACT|nr:TRAP transporter fused permease subunit [Malaciobacter marinus]PPK60960.1 TRAP transporter 4TM/12TM fusion protein [Malaciobacter marinus]SKB43793.1 TRAP transporter, 4TM/12TM fusion protein [Malaciobacter marinus]
MIKIKYFKEITFIYAIFISLFHFSVNIWGGLSNLWFNSAHFALLASLGFLTYEASKNKNEVSILNLLFAILSLLTFFYMMFFEESLYAVANSQMRTSDIIVASMTILLAIEMVRKSTGYVIPAIIVFCIAYILFLGQQFEGVFAFGGMSVERFLYRMFYTNEGLFGPIATISSTYVFMFILFAAFLLKSGAGDFIVDVANAVAGKYTGGTGHVAVISSALMGTISGSAVANTVSTGSITIPMMQKAGFKSKFAAAVEAAASTGGQIMPPIMGAGAFIMAQMTHIPFITIISVSILPAILYFASIAFYINIHAKENNIKGESNNVKILPILREGFHFVIPLSTLIGLLIYGFTPTYSAGIAIVTIVLASYLTKNKRMGIKDILEALALGSKNMIVTGVLLIAVGIIVGVINISGIGITFSQLIMQWSGNSLFIAIVLIAIASLVLGMGLPVTASYVVLSVLSAPALVGLMLSPEMAALVNAGVQLPEVTMYLLSAHLIIFWLSQDSNLTPPVCLAAFAAAAIAKTPPMATGMTSWKVGKGMYIIPLLFAFTPLINGTWIERFEVFGFALFGIMSFSIVMEGFWDRKMSILERAVFAVAAILLLTPDTIFNMQSYLGVVQNTHIVGFGIFAVTIIMHKVLFKEESSYAKAS